jgi:hypothetical protein
VWKGVEEDNPGKIWPRSEFLGVIMVFFPLLEIMENTEPLANDNFTTKLKWDS